MEMTGAALPANHWGAKFPKISRVELRKGLIAQSNGLKTKALNIALELGLRNFMASSNWLRRLKS